MPDPGGFLPFEQASGMFCLCIKGILQITCGHLLDGAIARLAMRLSSGTFCLRFMEKARG